jgi:hypothetical protein
MGWLEWLIDTRDPWQAALRIAHVVIAAAAAGWFAWAIWFGPGRDPDDG